MQSQQNRRGPASVGIDKRIHDRLPFDRRITITAFHSDGPLYFWGRTSDLSQGGIGATIVGDLAVNDVVSIQIPVPGGQELDLRALVRYRYGFHCGFEFLIIDERQRQLLQGICEEITNQSPNKRA